MFSGEMMIDFLNEFYTNASNNSHSSSKIGLPSLLFPFARLFRYILHFIQYSKMQKSSIKKMVIAFHFAAS
jgi:hypothetical protein